MKISKSKCIEAALAFCVYFLFTPQLTRGQGIAYLSNTNQPATGSSLTASFDIAFTTGTNSAGYLLTSLTQLFANNNTPVVVSAGLSDYSTVTYFGGGAEVGSAGYYTFTPNSPLALAANTPYALVVFPDDPIAEINVSYTTSSAFTSIDNWNISGLGATDESLFAITATPIEPTPEPTATSLACATIFAFIAYRIWTTHQTRNRRRLST
jgi:hypothetical protein